MANRPAQAAQLDPILIADLQAEILGWYEELGRRLPWREITDPYPILVSELMLQQTQVDRVIPKYENFLTHFPSPEILAAAPLSDVLVAWSGLGYNRRAKYLWDTAQILVSEHSAQFPRDIRALMSLPGVGPYTARAVAVFAFNSDEVLLETNTRRIYQLLWTGDGQSEAQLTALAHELLPEGRSADWHHALMDLGSAAAKHRSAAAQQQFLVETFPMLGELELPEFELDQVVRPRQFRFEGSRRQIRGAVLKKLSRGPASKSEVESLFPDDRLWDVVRDLEAEGFIQTFGEQLSLR